MKVMIKGLEMEKALLEEHVRYGEARFKDKKLVRPFVNRIHQDIAELEEAMKPKTCMGCSNYSYEGNNVGICSYFTCPKTDIYLDKDFCCNKFEPKVTP